jgi:serine/threonine protein kinase
MPGTVRPPSSAFTPRGSSASVVADARTAHDVSLETSPDVSLDRASTKGSEGASLPKLCPKCGVRYPAEFRVCPRDATELDEPAAADDDPMIGQTLSQTYTLLRVIGEGGMGRVYEARHTRIASKRFAVKMLHPEFARQPDVLGRFQREAEAAAAIHSPYVVDVYDVDRTADGRPFMVGELLHGKELADYLFMVGKMQPGPAVHIVRQICKALRAAHAEGVVHRDLKPENVFLTGDPQRPIAKVIDFGISKHGDKPGTALTKTGMIMGTPSYMAPEQARGERVDHRADIYAVGAILYCALTGERPFDRGDPTATLTAVLTQDPPRPRSLEPSIPEPLEMVIQRAMAKKPEERYASMEELDADLAPYDSVEGALSPAAHAGPSLAPGRGSLASTSLDRRSMTASMARPLILLFGVLGLVWLGGSVLTSISGLVRLIRGGSATANLSGTEAAFLFVGLFLALLTPALLAAHQVRARVWNNSVKAVDLADRLRAPVLVGLTAYGLASLVVRVLESVLLRRAVGVAWPVWDLLFFVVGVVAAGAAFALHEEERKKRR